MLATIVAAALTGCSGIREARMALPTAVASDSDTLRLTGMGLGRSGDFMLAEAPGRFTRSADRLGLFGQAFVGRTGASSFTLAGGLAGNCCYRESQVNAGILSLKATGLLCVAAFRATADLSRPNC
jgi:hypothetical protein